MKTADSPAASLPPPDAEGARQALTAARQFASFAVTTRGSHSLRIVPNNQSTDPVEVPEVAFRMFLEILNQMAQGNAISLVPTHHELTTQEAANHLRVSRPYLVKLLENGKIPFHRVGPRRRIKFEHLKNYLEATRIESREALDQLAAQAQELNMGY